ncbi:TetR/AcrR family transcriptional regulator [Gorillibacterium sp. CAU 1737]|uniref:TetR/AcrR family transcriptional regulator n=1 Tax=Gorillibacterium sp. CAU 1737 TaxID=3140362 RepID=UPI003260C5EB
MKEKKDIHEKKAAIFQSGKECFSSKGFKDTNISDITKRAGIAVGTFYNYYPSKEKLFMEIYAEENEKLKKSMMDSLDVEEEPLTVIKSFLSMNMAGIQSSPILAEWYNKDVFRKLEQLFREEKGLDSVHFLYGSFTELFKKWQAEGKIRSDLDVELIMAFFSALIHVDLHKEEIGLQHFPHILDYLMEFVMNGLNPSK